MSWKECGLFLNLINNAVNGEFPSGNNGNEVKRAIRRSLEVNFPSLYIVSLRGSESTLLYRLVTKRPSLCLSLCNTLHSDQMYYYWFVERTESCVGNETNRYTLCALWRLIANAEVARARQRAKQIHTTTTWIIYYLSLKNENLSVRRSVVYKVIRILSPIAMRSDDGQVKLMHQHNSGIFHQLAIEEEEKEGENCDRTVCRSSSGMW